MKKKHDQCCTLSVLLLTFVLLASAASPLCAGTFAAAGLPDDPPVMVTIFPASGVFIAGQVFTVEVWVENVFDLYGVDIQLAFDPALLQVVDPIPGTSKVEVTPRYDLLSPDLVVRYEADNTAGTVWYAVSQLNPSEPVAGSGALFEFQVLTVPQGVTQIQITNQQLVNQNSELIVVPTGALSTDYTITLVNGLFLPLVLR